MFANSELVLKEVLDKNPVTQLWAKITSSPIFKIKLLEFIKLVKITCVFWDLSMMNGGFQQWLC